MSWDYVEKKHPCPCGQETYTEIIGSNDWGQTSCDWRMDCPLCGKMYSLYTYTYYRHGMAETGHRWVKQSDQDAAKKLKSKAQNLRSKAATISRNRYLKILVDRFAGASKKAVWQVLRDNIPSFPSLATFYSHTKSKTTSEYLAELFDNIESGSHVLKLLDVDDADINALLTEAEICDAEVKQLLE